MANTIAVSVVGDVRDINRKLGTVEKQLGGFGKSASKLGTLLKGAFAGAAAVSLFKGIVSASSDAQQSLGATETVFGKFADTVIKTSDKAATKYGLSANTYRENANLIGSLFKNQGVSADQLAGKTDKLIATGADLAATFGGTTTSAVEALGSAFKGEFDPLERYGISIKQSSVNALLAAKGQDKLTGAAAKAAQQQAVTELVMKQSSGSLGAFGKESDTLAHQQQVLAAKFENVKAKIGNAFLPIVTKVVAFISDKLLPAFTNFDLTPFKDAFESLKPVLLAIGTFIVGTLVPGVVALTGFIRSNSTVFEALAVGVGAAFLAFKTYQAGLAIWAAVTKAYAAVQVILNTVMAANPIGIVILAIIGLAAALVFAYKKSETFRKVVTAVWDGIKSATVAVWNFLKAVITTAIKVVYTVIKTYFGFYRSVITGAWNAIKTVVSAAWSFIKRTVSAGASAVYGYVRDKLGSIKTAWSAGWNYVKTKLSDIWTGIKTAARTAIGTLVGYVRDIKGRITGVFSSAGTWLASAGRRIIQGLIDSVTAGFRRVKDKFNELTSLIPDWKGPASTDAKLLYGAGQLIMNGLIGGIDDKTNALKRQLRSVTGIVAGTDVGSIGLGDLSMAGAGSGSGNTYNITVNALDPRTAGKVVVDALKDYEKDNGTGWRRS